MKFEEITGNSERVRESHLNNIVEWGGSLSVDDYLERERRLSEIHHRNGLIHRVFAVIDDADHVIGACETLSRPLYRGEGEYSTDHCVASVFVKKEARRHGAATFMLSHLVQLFNTTAEQMSLWSDVGDYYARFGFVFPLVFEDEPHWHRTIVCQGTTKEVDCEMLDLARVNQQIVPEHTNELIRKTDILCRECNGEVRLNLVVPHAGLYEQLQFRALFTAEKLGIPQPTKFGARTLDSHGWISWTYFFDSKKLMVLGLFGSTNEIGILMAAAAAEAARYGCYVELYESSMMMQFGSAEEAALTTLGLEFEVKERATSLAMSKGAGIWVYPGGYAWY